MTLSLTHITFDCRDAVVLSGFWAAALGREVDDGAAPFFATIGYPPNGASPTLMFLQVPEAKAVKNRVHLDLDAEDRDAEVARLVTLGATEIGRHQEWGHDWTVMRDPEGNEFCVAQIVADAAPR